MRRSHLSAAHRRFGASRRTNRRINGLSAERAEGTPSSRSFAPAGIAFATGEMKPPASEGAMSACSFPFMELSFDSLNGVYGGDDDVDPMAGVDQAVQDEEQRRLAQAPIDIP